MYDVDPICVASQSNLFQSVDLLLRSAQTGVPILSASSSTGLMIFSWLLFSERRSAQTKRVLRNLLASPVPVKVAVAREDPEYPSVARRLQYDFLKFFAL